MRAAFIALVCCTTTALLAISVAASPNLMSVVNEGTFDYVVVGGGTAGCVAVAELIEANPLVRVLAIEAGHDNTDEVTPDNGNGPVLFPGFPLPDVETPLIERHSTTEKNPGLFTKHHYLPISRTLGGGSTTNGMTYSRASRQDWERFNVTGWTFDSVSPFAKKIERYSYPDPTGVRGTNGKLNLRRFPTKTVNTAFIKSMSDVLDVPVVDTLDSGDARGASQFYRNMANGDVITRQSAWTEYLKPLVGSAPNLVLITDAVVTSISFKKGMQRNSNGHLVYDTIHPLRAQYVYYTINGVPSAESRRATIGKEVLLAAGTLNTPKLLMLSGIGPAEHLTDKGIDVMLDSPRVGLNLRDHMYMPPMQWLFANPLNETEASVPLTFARTGLRADKYNDMEIVAFQAANLGPQSVYAAVSVLTRNSANGHVRLVDNNPTTMPDVTFNAFQDPLDALSLNFIANVTRAVAMNTPGFITELVPGFLKIPPGAPLGAWAAHTQSSASQSGSKSYSHFVGTCTMGATIDTSVVDPKLLVHGTINMRVIDLSVLPDTTSQSPFATAMLIGSIGAHNALEANGDL